LVLAFEQVEDDGFEISGLYVRFTISPAISAKVIDDEVDVLIVTLRHDRRRSACSGHTLLPQTQQNWDSNRMPIIGSGNFISRQALGSTILVPEEAKWGLVW
jgi:hypothetical protein